MFRSQLLGVPAVFARSSLRVGVVQKAWLSARSVTQPTEQVPDVETFLTRIGRNLVQHKDQFETWESLVGVSSAQLKDKGIDTRDRRYLLAWLQKFSEGAPLQEHKRGTKRWGGERKRRAERAAFWGRKRAEEKKA